jgi:RNA polymerase sigma factor (sigma-70 family)
MSKKFGKSISLKSLAKREDGIDIPMSWGEWESFYGVDLYTLYEEARDYLEKSGVLKVLDRDPNEEIDALYVAMNFDEWAPVLFKRLNTERKRQSRQKKRSISLSEPEEVADKQNPEQNLEWKIFFSELLSSRDLLKELGKNAANILKIKREDPDTTQDEIATKLGIRRETVNRTLKKIKTYLATIK